MQLTHYVEYCLSIIVLCKIKLRAACKGLYTCPSLELLIVIFKTRFTKPFAGFNRLFN